MLKRTFFILIIEAFLALSGFAQAPAIGTDVVMILPFENTSGKPEFNWVGESFADSLSDLLRVPNLNVITNEQRKLIQQKLRIPLTTLPSLATSLKLARESNSTLLIAGRYNIVPAGADTAATINVTAKIIRVNEGRFMSEVIDGRQITPRKPADAVRAGIGFVAEDRRMQNILPDLSVKENLLLAHLGAHRGFGLGYSARQQKMDVLMGALGLPAARLLDASMLNFSGGMQQKIIIARWLLLEPKVLMLDEPTKGVDIGTRQAIYEILRRIAARVWPWS